jgi:nucleoside-diphosphate-sugar epimerase
VARALIVACGCRGRALGAALAEAGWRVRGTTRDAGRLAGIEAAGIEAAVADPGSVGTVLDQIDGVAIVYWLLGSAEGEPGAVEAVNGARLEALFEKLVDTPVRGLVYEGAGSATAAHLAEGARIAREATARWRIPVEVVEADPADPADWRAAMLAAGERALLER